ncbi:MAG: hypothetical protein IPK96_11605 [Flammeovirgaceae bacterium]|nr:hypothetical protein [Flammeovirgaceae bacterium]
MGFKKDGILNEDFFISPRILFICKEPNDKDLNEGDYRKWWEKGLAFRFGLRLGEWAYGLINNFPAYEEFSTPQAHEAFMKTAFMNVKNVEAELGLIMLSLLSI